jgi:hypothetical protein
MSRNGSSVMMHRRSLLAAAGSAGLCTAVAWSAQSQTKSGTVEIEQIQVAYIGSGNIGSGTLQYQGKSYRISVGGVGGYGISRLQASGDVFGLKELRQFPGAYGQARSGVALGNSGGIVIWRDFKMTEKSAETK